MIVPDEKIKSGKPDCNHFFHRYYLAGMMPIYKCRCGAYYYEEDKEETPRCRYNGKFYNEANPTCCWKHKWFGNFIGN